MRSLTLKNMSETTTHYGLLSHTSIPFSVKVKHCISGDGHIDGQNGCRAHYATSTETGSETAHVNRS